MLGLQLDAIAIQQQEPNNPTNDMEEEPQQNWDEFDNIEEGYNVEDNNIETNIPDDYMEQEEENATSSIRHCLQDRIHSINTRIFADNVMIGGTAGRFPKYNARGHKNKRITWIRIWAERHSLRRVELGLLTFQGYNVYRPRYYGCGRKKGTRRAFLFLYGEHITQLKIWGNNKCGSRGRVTRVQFRTNFGRRFGIGRGKGYPYIPHIGTGIPGGMLLRCGNEIVDAFAFLLYNK